MPVGVLFRVELDRNRAESLRFSPALLSCDREGFRAWPMLFCDSASGDETRSDLGRGWPDVGTGDGDAAVFLAKGLLRHF